MLVAYTPFALLKTMTTLSWTPPPQGRRVLATNATEMSKAYSHSIVPGGLEVIS